MDPRSVPSRGVSEVYRYTGLGCLFAAAVLVFMGGGWLVDRWLGTVPVFMVVGALAGAALATASIYRQLQVGGRGGRGGGGGGP